MVKVLNIPTNGIRREGINSMLLRWVNLIDKTKINIDIAAVHNNATDVIEDYQKLGCRVMVLPDRQHHPIKYYISLFKLLKKEQYNAIHVHGSSGILGIELYISRLAGIKIRIAHSRNTTCDHLKSDILFRQLLYKNMTKALACSFAAGEWLFGNYSFEVMHNGIDASKFKFRSKIRQEIRKELRVDGNLVLGFVGNIKEQKNPLFLIDCIYELHKVDKSAVLLVVGDGDLKEKMESRAQKFNIEKNIFFVGRSKCVADLMSAMDILLFPSLFEGLGNVVLEAQISGLPVLVSDKVPRDCGLTELVKFLPIDKGVNPWINSIKEAESILLKVDREKVYSYVCSKMKEEHFDVLENASRLEEIYCGR